MRAQVAVRGSFTVGFLQLLVDDTVQFKLAQYAVFLKLLPQLVGNSIGLLEAETCFLQGARENAPQERNLGGFFFVFDDGSGQ